MTGGAAAAVGTKQSTKGSRSKRQATADTTAGPAATKKSKKGATVELSCHAVGTLDSISSDNSSVAPKQPTT
jgi:hypothetical protein